MVVKARMQGNSVTATFPKYLGVQPGAEFEPEKTPEGILFKFVPKEDNDFNFDRQILQDLISEGYSGESMIDEFEKRKGNLPQALTHLTQKAVEEGPITKEELRAELGLSNLS